MTDRRWDTERQEWVYPGDWRPIADAPRDGSDILAWGPALGHLVVAWDSEHDPKFPWGTLDGPYYFEDAFEVWMHLPEPPNEK